MSEEKREREEEQEEPKVIVRDRRRVTMEGTLREVEESSTPSASPPPSEGTPAASAEKPRPHLREVPPSRKRPSPGRAAPSPDAAPPTGEAREAPEAMGVYELAQLMLGEFQYRALIHLGLIPDPTTKLVSLDLEKARFAIDVVIALADRLQQTGTLSNEERQELQRVKHALQNAYVERVMGGQQQQPFQPGPRQ